MSSEKVARTVVHVFGGVKVEFLRRIVEVVGTVRVACSAGVNPSSVSSALSRNSLGEDLAWRLFKGIAEKYPEILRTELEKLLREMETAVREAEKELEKLIERKITGQ